MTREVIPGIFEIDTKPLGHEKLIASYLVKGSDKVALVDPGFASSVETIKSSMTDAGFSLDQIDYILLTHTHIDHAGGAGHILKQCPRAMAVTHQRGSFYLRNSVKISGGSSMIFGELSGPLGQAIDIPEERILTISDGDILDLGDRRMKVNYTPGHSGDHVSFVEEVTGTLFTGDTGCINYPELGNVLIPAGSPPIYRSGYILEELDRLAKYDLKKILTPHYGEADGSPAEFLEANIEAVNSSKIQINNLFKQGLEFQQVIEALRKDIIGRSGKAEAEIPEFLRDVWLRIMLKTGLMGFMADILEYARDLRPFTIPEEGAE